MNITTRKLKDIAIEVVERFGVIEIHGIRNEIDQIKIDEWIDNNYSHLDSQSELKQYSIDEIRTYLSRCDSFGDAVYNLSRINQILENEAE